MSTRRAIEQAVLWAAIEDYPGLWSLVDEVQAHVPDRDQATETAREVARDLVSGGALGVLTAPAVEDEPVPVTDPDEAMRLIADPRWWRTPESFEEPVVRVDITRAGEQRYKSDAALGG